ncbi:MAG: hypothetical protein H3C35_06565 [Bacteroidetes bacterium]|nr:hypothetical protein [Bacteroidota bacterium]
MKKYWSVSNNPSKIKMLGWGILMLFFRKETIARIRAWIVKRTPLKWGEWKNIQTWQPPKEVEQLLGK